MALRSSTDRQQNALGKDRETEQPLLLLIMHVNQSYSAERSVNLTLEVYIFQRGKGREEIV